MRKRTNWIVPLGLLLAVSTATAQDDEAAKANALYREGKKLDALPLYEELVKNNPKEWVYAERLAVCLEAKSAQTNDPSDFKALRARERDAAQVAVQLGDPNVFVQMMAKIDPDAPVDLAPADRGLAFMREAEKAFTAGDFSTAFAKYAQAAEADPNLYAAPLYAGDTAFNQKDLKTAAVWFTRAIAVDPNRETAYRYWGDAIMALGNDPMAAKSKFIDAMVAEPYSKYAWQGIRQWAQKERAVVLAPKIDRPAAPLADPNKPNNVTINIDPGATDDKKHPGGSAWLMYSIVRAGYRGDEFKKDFPDEKEYRHTLKEEDSALDLVATSVAAKRIKLDKMDESLRNLVELKQAGMLDCWILINGADDGIAQDYDAYRKDHRQLLHDYLDKFVVHGGINPAR